jgi:hypothetical protein
MTAQTANIIVVHGNRITAVSAAGGVKWKRELGMTFLCAMPYVATEEFVVAVSAREEGGKTFPLLNCFDRSNGTFLWKLLMLQFGGTRNSSIALAGDAQTLLMAGMDGCAAIELSTRKVLWYAKLASTSFDHFSVSPPPPSDIVLSFPKYKLVN